MNSNFDHDQILQLLTHLVDELGDELLENEVALGAKSAEDSSYQVAINAYGAGVTPEFLQVISQKADEFTQKNFDKKFSVADLSYDAIQPAVAATEQNDVTFTKDEIRAVKEHVKVVFQKRFESSSISPGITGNPEEGYQLVLRSMKANIKPVDFLQEIVEEVSRFTQEQFGKVFDAKQHLDYAYQGPTQAYDKTR